MLKDLGVLSQELSKKYENFIIGLGEKPLSESFKKAYKEEYNQKHTGVIRFFDTTAVHKSSLGQYSYIPAQWFYIATFWSEYCAKLFEYKRVFEKVFDKVYSRKDHKSICDSLRKGNPMDKHLQDAIADNLDGNDIDLFKKFLTDYDWWHGSKTIDRGDFHHSPILELAKVVNVNSGIVPEICEFLAHNSGISDLLSIEQISEDGSNLEMDHNLIIYGAPGTGKSFEIKNRAQRLFPTENVYRITFHPEFTYSKFVGTYKPESMYRDGEEDYKYYDSALREQDVKYEPLIDYKFEPGVFLESFLYAYQNPTENVLLVIEEINRANVAEVFGDIFQLLDRHEDGSSIYPIKLQKSAMKYLHGNGYKESSVSLPSNLYIWSSMNSADQGVYPLDSAFKRRWVFEFLPLNQKSDKVHDVDINFAGSKLNWNKFRGAVNSHLINHGVNEDKLIGPFFLSRVELENKNAVKNKLLLYLRDDVLRHNPQVLFKHETMSSIFNEYEGSKIENLFAEIFLDKYGDLFQNNAEDGSISDIADKND